MDEMRLVVTGAAGRMGQELIRAIKAQPGAVLAGAIEREGSEAIGKDAGILAGTGESGVIITSDPLPVFAAAEGVLDFTAPAASVEFAGLAAQARIVHVHRHDGHGHGGRGKGQGRRPPRNHRQVRQFQPRRQSCGDPRRAGRAHARQ